MTATKTPRKRTGRGRPQGSKTQTPAVVTTPASRCPKCASTERTPYNRTNETEHGGIDSTGAPYTHIVRRWCACSSCGQHRIDRTYENRPAKAA